MRGRGWGVDSVLLLPCLQSTSWPLEGSKNLLPVRVLEQAGALPRMTGATKWLPNQVVLARREGDGGLESWPHSSASSVDKQSVMLTRGRLPGCLRAAHLLDC